jgi:branched-chain amino acid transport system ATP-binding protein
MTTTSAAAALAFESITAGYGRTTVLRGITLEVPPASVVALLGPNGAGKTTTLRIAAGTLSPTSGTVSVAAEDVTRMPSHKRARRGVCLIPEGRGIFRSLTVRENLRLAVPPWLNGASIEPACAAFPILGKRLHQTAGTLSGGQQQMLALSRAFLAEPSVVLLDEVSMGLAPIVVDEIFEALKVLTARNISLLVVEQYVHRALELADYVYLMDRGQVGFSGRPGELDEDELARQYLGV